MWTVIASSLQQVTGQRSACCNKTEKAVGSQVSDTSLASDLAAQYQCISLRENR